MFKKIAFILCNFAIVLLEIISLYIRFVNYEDNMFLYYTVHSNLIALVVCLFSAIMAIKNKYFGNLYLWSACLVAFTFVIMCVGSNSVEGGYYAMFLEGACLINHLVCPLAMISCYVAFFPKHNDNIGCFWAILTTLAYGTTMYLLNAFRVVQGPYFFFEVHSMTLAKTLVLLLILVALSFATSYLVRWLKILQDKRVIPQNN